MRTELQNLCNQYNSSAHSSFSIGVLMKTARLVLRLKPLRKSLITSIACQFSFMNNSLYLCNFQLSCVYGQIAPIFKIFLLFCLTVSKNSLSLNVKAMCYKQQKISLPVQDYSLFRVCHCFRIITYSSEGECQLLYILSSILQINFCTQHFK